MWHQAQNSIAPSGYALKYTDMTNDTSPVIESYIRYDRILYQFAEALLDYDLLSHPDCRCRRGAHNQSFTHHVQQVHERLEQYGSYLEGSDPPPVPLKEFRPSLSSGRKYVPLPLRPTGMMTRPMNESVKQSERIAHATAAA